MMGEEEKEEGGWRKEGGKEGRKGGRERELLLVIGQQAAREGKQGEPCNHPSFLSGDTFQSLVQARTFNESIVVLQNCGDRNNHLKNVR